MSHLDQPSLRTRRRACIIDLPAPTIRRLKSISNKRLGASMSVSLRWLGHSRSPIIRKRRGPCRSGDCLLNGRDVAHGICRNSGFTLASLVSEEFSLGIRQSRTRYKRVPPSI